MLQIKNITKKYSSDNFEQLALNNVSMNFRNSEFVSILGQSGSGKTTLLNIIGGLDQYSSGDLIINGISTKRFTDRDWDTYRNYSIGFVFQSYNLIGHQSILSNVEMALTLTGVKKAERRRRAIQALTNVGLENHLHKRPNQLSGGQMQRVAIARALVNNPDIILADEPTGALDSDTSVQIMEILKIIAQNKLVIMVTHNPELAEEYSTRIIRVKDGHIVGDTNPYSDAEYAKDNGVVPINNNVASGYAQLTKRTSPLDECRLSGERLANGPISNVPHQSQPIPQNISSPPPQKTSMNFLTALTLSLNNLLTKKGRTLLTSFAGSIGIIGIALILAISTGVNNYIEEIQHDTLASYPIQIQKETTDMTAMFNELMGEMTATSEDKSGRTDVHATPLLFDSLKSVSMGQTAINNLAELKKYFDKHLDELDEYSLAIQYGYDIDLSVFAKGSNGKYIKADFDDLMSDVMGGQEETMASTTTLLSSVGGVNIWEELLTDPTTGELSNLIADQYDLVYGKWPTEKNELVLVLNADNEISDLTLYSLGLIDKDTMTASVLAAMTGKESKSFDDAMAKTWTHEEICNIPLKMVLPTEYYRYDESLGLWVDISENDVVFNSIIEKGLELKVTGVIKPKPDSNTATISGSLCYTHALTEYYLEHVNKSEIIQQQLSSENSNKNIITGLPFVAKEKEVELTDAEKVTAFKEYVEGLTDAEKAELYQNILANPDEKLVQEAIDSVIKEYEDMTAEEIVDTFKKNYSEEMGYSTEIIENMFKDYTKDELLDLLKQTATDSIKASYASSAQTTINDIKKTPNETELKEIKEELKKEMFESVTELPESQQESAKFTIKIGYIAQSLVKSGLSEDSAMSYLYSLGNKEINDIFDRVLTETATEVYKNYGGAGSDAENIKKVSTAFDKYFKECSDEDIVAFYNNNMLNKVSDLSFNELLDEMGYATLDNPAFINIYPKDFDNKTKITNMIKDYNKTADEENKIEYTDMTETLISSISTIISAISVVLICFVAISLVVSSIMIGIITYISVLERTKEIGILRAVGASKSDISRVFNAETMIVGFLAGVVGIISTVLMCIPINVIARAITGISTFSATLPWTGYLLIVLSMVLTLIAGIFPAMMAAKKDPVIALRSE